MEQKRFLTADEVFQMFGVDANALEDLVNSGAVKSLADFGSFKYRSEDFVALVKNGTLTPRTSGELFDTDSDGNIPFLTPKSDSWDAQAADDVSYIELDEAALNEQANPDAARHATQVSPESWFDDSEDSIADLVSQGNSEEPNLFASNSNTDEEQTEPDFKIQDEISGLPDSDSDVRIVGMDPVVVEQHDSSESAPIEPEEEVGLSGAPIEQPFLSTASDSDVVLIHSPNENAEVPVDSSKSSDSDSDVRLSGSNSFDIEGESVDFEMGSGLADEESGIRLVASSADSGISLAGEDSGISLSDSDSGISLMNDHESGISLAGDDSGISLSDSDSGISLVGDDSGISLSDGESGIRLSGDDSGISLLGGDSGITLENDVVDPQGRASKEKPGSRESAKGPKKEAITVSEGSDPSQTLDLSDEFMQDSGFDVSLAEEDDQTAELDLGRRGQTTPGFPTTVFSKGTPDTGFNTTGPTLSETFQLDEPPEVEDLDISDDLEDAPASDFSDEFAAVEDEEVFEASDDDFSADDVSVADEEYLSDEEVLVPTAKVKKGPKEPEWGLLAVGPIAFASLLMLATATVLWGGVATMWTGAEAPGPAATLISTLAGLSPF